MSGEEPGSGSGSGSFAGSGSRVRVSAATRLGSEHARLGRNNQDAVAGCESNGAVAIVVADGCGEGEFSEVGSRLIARFVSEHACADAPDVVVEKLVAWLGGISKDEAFIQEQLLATFLCAVARDDGVIVFGIGDGVVFVDGARTVLPAVDNAPPYVAYRLLGMEAPLVIHHHGPAKRVAIATDGARTLELEPSFGWTNPQALQRRLNTTAGLHDDCTVALMELATP